MRKAFAVALIGMAFGLTASGVASAKTDLLDGKVFVGQVGKIGKARGDKDQFVFQGGTFHSTACDPHGFKAVEYTADQTAQAVAFQAESANLKKETMLWRGMVQGDQISGTAVWERPGKKPAEYWFKGHLKQQ